MNIYGKRLGEYFDVMKTPIVLLIALSIVQFVVRIIAYFMKQNIIRILGWIVFAVIETIWVIMLLYLSWIAVRHRKWSSMNLLFTGLVFGLIGGLITSTNLIFGNIVAVVLSESWGVFKAVVWSGITIVFLPLLKCILGGFISGVIGVVFED